MKENPKDLVREGYDRIAEQYDEYRSHFSDIAELDAFVSIVKPGGRVLDAGCGTGIVARALVDNGYQVTGIDISQKMLDLANRRVPEATFEVGDMTALQYEDESFDGIVSTYAVFHIPRTKHYSLFLDFHRILRKGGALLFGIGSKETDGTDGVWKWEDFQSVPMFWSYYPPSKTVELLVSAGFQIVFARNVEQAGETHHWILARAK
jgi:ubiquinone/menaquinone biosynthesis C-methylase UbiE